ncbi:LytTR family DNA-binding domain-containing protein [Phaeodactylibacter xiamenensis]|uniref:LytTR family DNA-binding domain-containing protein n=1 Tax=Phaeodactylibacter xiamenensis TaxID=1524460 RepID=UPI0024A8266F|nr:LytTR family DNA-binding domain-containing protein [Phaeodactylibacter xiamenensis]
MSNGWAQLKQYLSRPHYWEDRPWAIFRQALGFGAITFAVLWFFEPFGFYQLSSAALLMVSLEISAAVIFFICLNWWLLYRLFPNFEPADQWMVKHELILTLFTTLLIAVAVGGILHAHDIIVLLNLRQAFKVLLNTALIALVPILIFVARDQNRLLKRHLNQAEQYTRQLQQPAATPGEALVSLPDENGKPVLQLPAERILFLQAAGNYAEVHFLDETRQPRRELLRNRLKVLSEVLPEDQFIQCHRSYLANRQLIRQVKGNARNYELVLEGANQTVPVARSKAAPVMAIIGKT